MQIHSVVFAISPQINKKKYAKTINLLCAGNKVFVKYQAHGRGQLQPLLLCLSPWSWCRVVFTLLLCFPGRLLKNVPHRSPEVELEDFCFSIGFKFKP